MMNDGQQFPVSQQGPPPQWGQAQQPGPTIMQPQLLPVSAYQPPAFNMNFESMNADDVPREYWWLQGTAALGGVANNIVNSALNYSLSYHALDVQKELATDYYLTQRTGLTAQKEVALKDLDVRGQAILAQENMHSAQVFHEEEMGRLEKNTQIRLAQISEGGRTERAKILSMSNAFVRGGWDYGSTVGGVGV